MIVVADTTPLNYLVLIGQIELLSVLYRTVLIPQEVHRELQQSGTPPAVRAWASRLPTWCEVRASSSTPDPALSELDPGERGKLVTRRDVPLLTPPLQTIKTTALMERSRIRFYRNALEALQLASRR